MNCYFLQITIHPYRNNTSKPNCINSIRSLSLYLSFPAYFCVFCNQDRIFCVIQYFHSLLNTFTFNQQISEQFHDGNVSFPHRAPGRCLIRITMSSMNLEFISLSCTDHTPLRELALDEKLTEKQF